MSTDVHHTQILYQIFQRQNEIHQVPMLLYIHLSNTRKKAKKKQINEKGNILKENFFFKFYRKTSFTTEFWF